MVGPAEGAATAQQLLAAFCSGYNLAHFLRTSLRASGGRRLAAGVLALVNLAFLAGSAASLAAWRLMDGIPILLEVGVAACTLAASASISALILRQRLHRGR